MASHVAREDGRSIEPELTFAQRALGPLASYSVPCREALFGAVGEAIVHARTAGELGLVERLLSASHPTRERARHLLGRVPVAHLFAQRSTLPPTPPLVAWLVTDAEETPPTVGWRSFERAREALGGRRDVENAHMLTKPPGSPRILLAVSVFEDAAVVQRLSAPRP